ncbi:MAG: ParB/RepB/Spo0J family partition protein [Phycisphaerales bacterium]
MKASTKRSKVPSPVRMLPIDRMTPTPDNKRRPITQSSVESLAKSLAREGVLQPIVVRSHPEKDGWFEIRAGERRWRAAKLAGLTHIPAFIRSLDDESALSVTIAENLQRQDLHPLEEAATIQQAFDRGYDAKAVAARLGKSVVYIARRASLTRLCTEWRDEVLKADTDASRLTVAHLELVARLPEETQRILAENNFHRVFARGFPTVAELRRVIDGGLQSLRAMPWSLEDETLDPKAGACLNCPKRSGMHPMLFDTEDAPQGGKVSKTDRCLDPVCFEGKAVAHLQQRESALRSEYPTLRLVQVGFSGLSPRVRETFGERVTQVYQPKFVKPTAKGATPAMQLDGAKAGTLVHIDFGESVSRNGTTSTKRPTDETGKPVPLSLADRKARLQKRRDAFLVNKVGESLRALTPEALTTTAATLAARTDAAAKRFNPLALVLAFGTSTRADREHDDGPWKRYEELLARSKDLPIVVALHEVTQVWSRRLGGSDTHHVTEQAADARKVCELLGIDAPAIETEAATAIPTPKNWASLAESTGSNREAKAPASNPSRKTAVRSAQASTPVRPSGSAGKRNRSSRLLKNPRTRAESRNR